MPPRRPTYPLAHAARRKPRRIPLVLRFTRGSIHSKILLPIVIHSLFTVLIVYLDRYVDGSVGLPSTIVPSLSIVVGLMLVFRNSTSFDRFWTGRNSLTEIGTCVRCLARGFLVSARAKDGERLSEEEMRDTDKAVRVLVAVLYAIKHNLRAEFNLPPASLITDPDPSPTPPSRHPSRPNSSWGSRPTSTWDAEGLTTAKAEYISLLPENLMGYEDQGLSLPLQLTILLESFIRRGVQRTWFHAPQAALLTTQLNTLVGAYGRMETIRTTPLPVAHLIHHKQVLALYVSVLPFAIVDDYGWWAVLVVGVVAFTLYGIEGIGGELEDPFGYDKNDIKMDGIIEDCRQEVVVLLEEWRGVVGGVGDGEGEGGVGLGGMFD